MKILPALTALGVVAAAAAVALLGAFGPRDARATMAFTQQTGKACTYCHAPSPPALNAEGKKFKANGNKL